MDRIISHIEQIFGGTLQRLQPYVERVFELLQYNPKSPLIFSSGLFLFIFLGFALIYSLLRKQQKLRILYVVAFSLYFYYKTNGMFFLLLIALSLSDFFIGKGIHGSSRNSTKRWLVALSICINIGVLCYFKYTDLILSAISGIFDRSIPLQGIFVPVGISFFTFQSISYVVDMYRGQIEPVKRWVDYLFYLSFFPVLVAGPIVRAKDFIPQIYKNPVVVTKAMFGTALYLIATGLFKKAIISDYISLNFVDRVFDAPMLYSGFENLMAVYGYAMQIYCDFSGYSDMAIGISLLLGFKINMNFDSPYKSATITEFWRRWHISLSSWLKDYLYIPLGGNRRGKFFTYVNLFVTMLIGGLWHGASLRFIFWGALHGIALAGHKFMMTYFPWLNFKTTGAQMKPWRRFLGIVLTLHIVCAGWILFRADNMVIVKEMLSQIFHSFDLMIIPEVIKGYGFVFLLMAVGYFAHFIPGKTEDWFKNKSQTLPIFVHILILSLLIWFVMQIKSSDIQPFIYFQF